MDELARIAERRIEEAQRSGAFDGLAGAGAPLELDDRSDVPEDLRAGYHLLKTHGCLPPELELRREWLRLEDLLAACTDAFDRDALCETTRGARLRYRLAMESRPGGAAFLEYEDALRRRFEPS